MPTLDELYRAAVAEYPDLDIPEQTRSVSNKALVVQAAVERGGKAREGAGFLGDLAAGFSESFNRGGRAAIHGFAPLFGFSDVEAQRTVGELGLSGRSALREAARIEGSRTGIGSDIATAVGQTIGDIPQMLVFRGPGGAPGRLATMGRVAGASAPIALRERQLQLSEEGVSVRQANASAMLNTVIPALFGASGVERIFRAGMARPTTWRAAAGKILADTGLEATEEAVTEVAEAFNEYANGDLDAFESSQLIRRIIVAASAGGIVGGGVSAVTSLPSAPEPGAPQPQVQQEDTEGMAPFAPEGAPPQEALPQEVATPAEVDEQVGQATPQNRKAEVREAVATRAQQIWEERGGGESTIEQQENDWNQAATEVAQALNVPVTEVLQSVGTSTDYLKTRRSKNLFGGNPRSNAKRETFRQSLKQTLKDPDDVELPPNEAPPPEVTDNFQPETQPKPRKTETKKAPTEKVGEKKGPSERQLLGGKTTASEADVDAGRAEAAAVRDRLEERFQAKYNREPDSEEDLRLEASEAELRILDAQPAKARAKKKSDAANARHNEARKETRRRYDAAKDGEEFLAPLRRPGGTKNVPDAVITKVPSGQARGNMAGIVRQGKFYFPVKYDTDKRAFVMVGKQGTEVRSTRSAVRASTLEDARELSKDLALAEDAADTKAGNLSVEDTVKAGGVRKSAGPRRKALPAKEVEARQAAREEANNARAELAVKIEQKVEEWQKDIDETRRVYEEDGRVVLVDAAGNITDSDFDGDLDKAVAEAVTFNAQQKVRQALIDSFKESDGDPVATAARLAQAFLADDAVSTHLLAPHITSADNTVTIDDLRTAIAELIGDGDVWTLLSRDTQAINNGFIQTLNSMGIPLKGDRFPVLRLDEDAGDPDDTLYSRQGTDVKVKDLRFTTVEDSALQQDKKELQKAFREMGIELKFADNLGSKTHRVNGFVQVDNKSNPLYIVINNNLGNYDTALTIGHELTHWVVYKFFDDRRFVAAIEAELGQRGMDALLKNVIALRPEFKGKDHTYLTERQRRLAIHEAVADMGGLQGIHNGRLADVLRHFKTKPDSKGRTRNRFTRAINALVRAVNSVARFINRTVKNIILDGKIGYTSNTRKVLAESSAFVYDVLTANVDMMRQAIHNSGPLEVEVPTSGRIAVSKSGARRSVVFTPRMPRAQAYPLMMDDPDVHQFHEDHGAIVERDSISYREDSDAAKEMVAKVEDLDAFVDDTVKQGNRIQKELDQGFNLRVKHLLTRIAAEQTSQSPQRRLRYIRMYGRLHTMFQKMGTRLGAELGSRGHGMVDFLAPDHDGFTLQSIQVLEQLIGIGAREKKAITELNQQIAKEGVTEAERVRAEKRLERLMQNIANSRRAKKVLRNLRARFGAKTVEAWNKNPELLTEFLKDPIKVAQVQHEIQLANADIVDAVLEWRNNMMLSDPSTISVASVSTALNLGFDITVRGIDALIGSVAGPLLPNAYKSGGREFARYIAAMLQGLRKGLKKAAFVLRHGYSVDNLDSQVNRDITAFGMSRGAAIGGSNKLVRALGRVVRIPQSLLIALDAIASNMYFEAEAFLIANRIVKGEGIKYDDTQYQTRINQEVQRIRSDPNAADFIDATKRGRQATLQDDTDVITKFIETGKRSRNPAVRLVMGLFFPFSTTISNTTIMLFSRSPIGGVARAIMTGVKGGVVQNREIKVMRGVSDALATTTMIGVAYGLATSLDWDDEEEKHLPLITGNVVPTPENWELAERVPDRSIRIAGRYWSYDGYDPLAGLLAAAADTFQAGERIDRDEDPLKAMTTALTEIGGATIDNSILDNVMDLAALVNFAREDWRLRSVVSNMAYSFVPNAYKRGRRTIYGTLPESRAGGNDSMERFSNQLARGYANAVSGEWIPKVDVWGNPVSYNLGNPADGIGWNTLRYLFRVQAVDVDDISLLDRKILAHNEHFFSDADKQYLPRRPLPNYRVDGERRYFSPQDYHKFLEASGKRAHDILMSMNWDPDEVDEDLPDIFRNVRSMVDAAERMKIDKGYTYKAEPLVDELLTGYLKRYRDVRTFNELKETAKMTPGMLESPEGREFETFANSRRGREALAWRRIHSKLKGAVSKMELVSVHEPENLRRYDEELYQMALEARQLLETLDE